MVLSYGGGFNTKATVECKILKIHDLVVKILKFKILSANFELSWNSKFRLKL